MKIIWRVLLILAISSSLAFAQSNNGEVREQISAEININAEIIQSIELITINSMEFGNVQPGQREIYVNPTQDLNAGHMIAVGTPGAEFRLNYLQERELTQLEGNSSLIFNYEISGNSSEDQSTSRLLEDDNEDLQFNEEGRYYIWVGGRIDLENAAPGNYEGDFTIEIDNI